MEKQKICIIGGNLTGLVTAIALSKLNCQIDLITGNVISDLKIKFVKKGVFNKYMEKMDRLGGQNKPQRISNNNAIAEKILSINEES